MPLTNPGRDGLEGGQAVFIDGPLDLPAQLMHQELENLVGLTDLDTLQDESHSQIIDTSTVLLTDEMEQMEESDDNIAMDTSSQETNHSMDVDCLSNSTSGIDAELSNLVPIESSFDENTPNQMSSNSSMHKIKEYPLNILETSAPQATKSSSNQFVILQPNQNSSFISLGGKLVPTGQLFSAISSTNNNKTTTNNIQSNTKQFRTIQVRNPSQLSQNSAGVTKVIINNQSSNLQQNKTTSLQNNGNFMHADGILKTDSKNSPSKVTLQFQPVGFSLGQRNVFQAVPKVPESKQVTQLAVPVSFALRPSNVSTIVKQEPTESLLRGSISAATVNSPQKIFIKGSMPLSSIKPGQILADSQFIKLPISQISQQPQTVQLSNKVNYVRLVNQPSSESSTNISSTMLQTAPKVINVRKQFATTSTQGLTIQSISGSSNTICSTSSGCNVQARTATNVTLPVSALPPQVLSNAHPGSLVMIPAHLLQNSSSSSDQSLIQVASQLSPTSPSKPQPTKTMIDANGIIKSRKPCNCTKSQCLKLYCDCFANGEFCNNCNCNNCFNNLSHEEDRQKAIKSCLERNPNAFRPKIGKGGTENKRRHNKGCNCKRSGCLKNYCECYEAKIPCSRICKCVGCRNIDNYQNVERNRLMEIAEATEAKVNHKIFIQNKAISLSSLPSPVKMTYPSTGKSAQCRINQEVVAATCHCLLAHAEEASRMGSEDKEKELVVINEFSRCLLQIIGCNVKSKD